MREERTDIGERKKSKMTTHERGQTGETGETGESKETRKNSE